MKDKVFIDSSLPQWKGNVHMHTIRSDGKLTPPELAGKYKDLGYNFIVISDHEVYWDSEELDSDGFLVLGGTESSVSMDRDNPWLLEYRAGYSHRAQHFGVIKDPTMSKDGQKFVHDQFVPRVFDRGIDTWNYAVQYLKDHGNIVFINHADWSKLTPELMMATYGCFAMEIWNSGNVEYCGGRDDSYIWDYLLRYGRRIYAIAGDDAHIAGAALGDSFNMVQCPELTREGLVDAFKRGAFYASCGPVFKDIRVEDGILKMDFSPVRRVEVVAFDGEGNSRYGVESLIEHYEWPIKPYFKYIRPFITDDNGRTAWAQPIFIDELNDAPVFRMDSNSVKSK